jgi:leucyl-tRNA synthetase
MGYGTGAIMAVPAHDTRDFEFAKEFEFPLFAFSIPKMLKAAKKFWQVTNAGLKMANTSTRPAKKPD